MKTRLALILLLAACSETAPVSADKAPTREETLRSNFIAACTEAARAANPAADAAKLGEVCACTHDETAASFGSPEQWQQALVRYDRQEGGTREIETRMAAASQRCVLRLLPESAAASATVADNLRPLPNTPAETPQ